MKSRTLLLLLALGAALPVPARGAIRRDRPDRSPASAPAASLPVVGPPLAFEENRGQADPAVRFVARALGFQALVGDAEAVFVLPRGTGSTAAPRRRGQSAAHLLDLVRMRFEGARPRACAAGVGPLPGRSHYLLGNEPSRWVRGVPSFAEVRTPGLLPGVALRWRGLPGGGLEYDLLVEPGSDSAAVAMRFEGAGSLALDGAGDLLVGTPGGVLRHGRPEAWQEDGGTRRHLAASFRLPGDGTVRFEVPGRDPALPLVIDPVVTWCSYLGGSGSDGVDAMAVDSGGAVYLAGTTYSSNFPVANAFKSSGPVAGYSDAFVTKFAADGSLEYSTYLGGTDSNSDYAYAVAVDSSGSAYVTGSTYSYNFPRTSGAFDVSLSGSGRDAFVTKLSSSGSSLSYSTYLGDDSADDGYAIAVASNGEAVVVGTAGAQGFPTKDPVQGTTHSGTEEVFVTRFNSTGSALVYSTFFGGSNNDHPEALRLDADGAPVVMGTTLSADFPVAGAYQGTRKGTHDSFLFKLAADGKSVLFSTYFGGSGVESYGAMALDSAGAVVFAGFTTSTDLPVLSAWQSTLKSTADLYVARFKADGSGLEYCTYLGGSGTEFPTSMAAAENGWVILGGQTASSDFPTVTADQATFGGQEDGFLLKIKDGNRLAYASFLGTSGYDWVNAVAADAAGRVWAAGATDSSSFPATAGAFDTTYNGSQEGYLWKGTLPVLSPPAPTGLTAALSGFTSCEVRWQDASVNEEGFEVQRRAGAGPYAALATTAAGVTEYLDSGLEPATTYGYRVRAFNDEGESTFTAEAFVQTPPVPTFPPVAPSGLAAEVVSPREVGLTWQDNGDDEEFFLLSRAAGSALFSTLATPRIDSTSFTDRTVLPGMAYSYKIRAVNPIGSSLDSATATVAMPSTLEVALVRGLLKDREAYGKDSLKVSGTLAYLADALAAAFDPAVQSLALRLGTLEAPTLLVIPAGDEGWRLRRGRWMWKSPKGSVTKAKVVVDPVQGTWSVALSRMTLPSAPGDPVRVTLSAGTDAGHHEAPWTPPGATGARKFPVPPPRE